MPGDDLMEHATSSHDFYELLGVTFETSEADIRRAYRKAALKYHPDKNAGKPEVVEKFHLLQIANDVLSDPAAKALYDNTIKAKRAKEERERGFSDKRKQMIADLERRESEGLKRKRGEDEDDPELARIAADGARRVRELRERRNREIREELEELDRLDRERNGQSTPAEPESQGGTQVDDVERCVKVKWVREGLGADIDKDRLLELFTAFGPVEHVLLLKDKKKKRGDRKVMVAAGAIVFSDVVGAYAAVEEYKKQTAPEFAFFDSIYWAGNKEPDFLQRPPFTDAPGSSAAPSTANSPSLYELTRIGLKMAEKRRLKALSKETPEPDGAPATPSQKTGDGKTSRHVPSFSTYKKPQASTHEEMYAAKSKEAERRALIEQIKAEDAAEDAAAEAEKQNAE
ncbi:hypothetical protein AAFC00_000285 [Neodothiora populina]|uniref:J domain-containing protein n=1 Tax=Neodothiora populina TaxID=2781224 RepID=A0ABR3PCH2_9PEZI